MSRAAVDPIAADLEDAAKAVEVLPLLRDYLARHREDRLVPIRVEDAPGPVLELPRNIVELLVTVLTHVAAGEGVSVVPAHAELTTQQAADLLNVSRPYVIGLLDAGEIEYRRVGRHRRIRAASLLDYRRRDDQRRREAADELTELAQEMGLD